MKSYKDKVRSIHTIVDKETENLSKQNQHFNAKTGRKLRNYAKGDSDVNKQLQQHDVSSNLKLSHIQNQNFINKQVKQDIYNVYIRADELNDSKNNQVKVQNLDEELSFEL